VLVFLGGLIAAALMLTLALKPRVVGRATTSSDARARAASDEGDLIRLDSDMG
jgi:hypothetical protein